jgi:hypothetical protein
MSFGPYNILLYVDSSIRLGKTKINKSNIVQNTGFIIYKKSVKIPKG